MKNIYNLICVLSFLFLLAGCTGGVKDFFDIPHKGTIEGYVIDELTGDSLENVTVTAHFIKPNDGDGEEVDLSDITTNDGFFRIDNIWDDARIAVEKEGYAPISFHVEIENDSHTEFNLYTRGNPLIDHEVISNTDVNINEVDTIYYFVEVTDPYNLMDGAARGDLFLIEQETGIRELAFPLVEISHTHLFTTLEAKIPTSAFLIKELDLENKKVIQFHFDEQVIDADGNIGFKDDTDIELTIRYE